MGYFWERDPQKRWARDTREWWLWLSIGLVGVIAIPFVFGKYSPLGSVLYGLVVVLVTFQAGFFYNDRLRQLGKTRGFLPKLRRPPSEHSSEETHV